MIVLRVLFSVALFTAPFLAFAIFSDEQNDALVLLLPLVGCIPAVIGALIVFLPVEAWMKRTGRRRALEIVIPILGALLIFGVLLVIGLANGRLVKIVEGLVRDPGNNGFGILVWSALGLVWGLVWRASDWLLSAFNWLRRRAGAGHAA